MKNMSIKLGDHTLKQSDCEPHLGGVLATSLKASKEYILERIKSCQHMCYAAQSLGSSIIPVTPTILSKIYQKACIPKLCYAMEIVQFSEELTSELEEFHKKNAKLFQGLSSNTANVGALKTIGWNSIKSYIEIMKMMFLWRLLLLPMSSWYKQIVIRLVEGHSRGCNQSSGPIQSIVEVCQKYELMNIILAAMHTGCYEMVQDLKKIIISKVKDHDEMESRVNTMMYRSLQLVDIKDWRSVGWWCFAKKYPWQVNKCRVIVRLLLNSYRLGTVVCPLCMCGQTNDIVHILFQCQAIECKRKVLLAEIYDVAPGALRADLEEMSMSVKTEYFLNALKCDFICEWTDLYNAVIRFVILLYKEYESLCTLR